MAIYGRRQPHAPLILSPTVIARGQPVGRLVRLSKNAQEAALLRYHPQFKPIIKRAGGPPIVGSVVVPRGQEEALALALAARQPRIFRPIIKGLGPIGSVSRSVQVTGRLTAQGASQRFFHPQFQPLIKSNRLFAPVARLVQVSRIAQQAALLRFRPQFRPIVRTKGTPPAFNKLVILADVANLQAAQIRNHPIFQPIIKTLGLATPFVVPSLSRVVQVGRVAQQAALLRYHPQFQPIINPLGTFLPVASPVILRGQTQSQAATRRSKLFRPTINVKGADPAVGRSVQFNRIAQHAAFLRARRPLFRPIILGLIQYATPPAPPAAAPVVVRGQGTAQASAVRFYHPIFQPIIKRPGNPLPVPPVIRPAGQQEALAAAQRFYHPQFQPVINPLGPALAVSQFVFPTGQAQSRDSALFARRPLFRPIIKTAGTPRSTAKFYLRSSASLQAAQRYRRAHHYKPIIGTLYTFTAPVVAPVAGSATVWGLKQSQGAALRARQPRIFKPVINTLIRFAQPAPAAPVAAPPLVFGRLASQRAALAGRLSHTQHVVPVTPVIRGRLRALPLVTRVPDVSDERRLARHTEEVMNILNSLIRQGVLVQTSPSEWKIVLPPE